MVDSSHEVVRGALAARPASGSGASEASRRRWALALCFITGILEGFDLQAMGVAAPGVAEVFRLSAEQIGYVSSASSVGLLVGALIGGIVSDRLGRRAVLMSAVFVFGVFSVLTPFAPDLNTLIVVRLLTGLGLGAGLPMMVAIATEAASPARRGGTVTMMYSATPIGGLLASSAAYAAGADWELIFYLGGIAPLLLTLLLYLRLRDAPASVRASATQENSESTVVALFGGGRAPPTLLLWTGLLCSLLVLYLLLNWLPLLLMGKGFSRGDASLVQALFQVGGSSGALILGWAIDRADRRIVLGFAYLALAGALAMLASPQNHFPTALLAGFAVGMFANGATFLMYGLVPAYYGAPIRGTGVGWAMAIGRFGSILGPILAGSLLGAGQSAAQVLLSILPIVLIAALAAQALQLYRKRRVF